MKPMENKYAIWPILSAVLLMAGCERDEVISQDRIPTVSVVTVSEQTLSPRLHFPAVAAAADRSELSFRVGGK